MGLLDVLFILMRRDACFVRNFLPVLAASSNRLVVPGQLVGTIPAGTGCTQIRQIPGHAGPLALLESEQCVGMMLFSW
jgi:hypothetical protein